MSAIRQLYSQEWATLPDDIDGTISEVGEVRN